MKKKKRLLPIVMASLMAMSINVGPLKAADAPLITNPSFEHEIDKNDTKLSELTKKLLTENTLSKLGILNLKILLKFLSGAIIMVKVVLMLFSITLSLTLHTRLLPITGMNPE